MSEKQAFVMLFEDLPMKIHIIKPNGVLVKEVFMRWNPLSRQMEEIKRPAS